MDDTLVWTSDADQVAHAAVVELAKQRAGATGAAGAELDGARLIADFRAAFKQTPWDPEYVVEVIEWRAGLWARALGAQGVADAAAIGPELQACFDTTRHAHFVFIDGVKEMVAAPCPDRKLRQMQPRKSVRGKVGSDELFHSELLGSPGA